MPRPRWPAWLGRAAQGCCPVSTRGRSVAWHFPTSSGAAQVTRPPSNMTPASKLQASSREVLLQTRHWPGFILPAPGPHASSLLFVRGETSGFIGHLHAGLAYLAPLPPSLKDAGISGAQTGAEAREQRTVPGSDSFALAAGSEPVTWGMERAAGRPDRYRLLTADGWAQGGEREASPWASPSLHSPFPKGHCLSGPLREDSGLQATVPGLDCTLEVTRGPSVSTCPAAQQASDVRAPAGLEVREACMRSQGRDQLLWAGRPPRVARGPQNLRGRLWESPGHTRPVGTESQGGGGLENLCLNKFPW